jgi:hypothetical protein
VEPTFSSRIWRALRLRSRRARVSAALVAVVAVAGVAVGLSTSIPLRSKGAAQGPRNAPVTNPVGSTTVTTSPPTSATSGTTTTTTLPHGGDWLLSGVALQLLGSNPLAQRVGDSDHTFLIVGKQMNLVPQGSHAILVASFTSYDSLAYTVSHGLLDPRIRAVIYDNENWDLTPKREQADPATYEQRAAGVAHSHGLIFISTPAVDLVSELDPGPGTTFAKYLQLGLAAMSARYADVIDIQAQGSQLDPQKYIQFVDAAASQARSANPNVVVLAGLSTNPRGAPIPLGDLVSIVNATKGTIDGYWLNIPIPGPSCPFCNPPQPGLGLQLLSSVGVR